MQTAKELALEMFEKIGETKEDGYRFFDRELCEQDLTIEDIAEMIDNALSNAVTYSYNDLSFEEKHLKLFRKEDDYNSEALNLFIALYEETSGKTIQKYITKGDKMFTTDNTEGFEWYSDYQSFINQK